MSLFTRLGRGQLLTAAAVAVFAVGAFAQNAGDTAMVPFVVNVNATVKAIQDGGAGSGARTVSMQVSAGEESVLRLPLGKPVGIAYAAPGRANAPIITNSPGGKITLNLPAQSYKNAEVSLYAVNGRRILRHKTSASEAVRNMSKENVVAGVYLLAVRGNDGNKFTARLTHRGGGMNIAVAFGGENIALPNRLAKKAADWESWTVTVSAEGYTSAGYTFVPITGENPPHNITLSAGYGAPAYVTATVASSNSIKLSWSAVSGATVYRVYRDTSESGPYTLIGTSQTTSYTNTVSQGTTYYYKVAAFNSVEESAKSSYVSAIICDLNAPGGVIATVALTVELSNRITVSWAENDNADGYKVYRSIGDNDTYTLAGSLTTALYTDSGLTTGTVYAYKVSAYNRSGESSQSLKASARAVELGTFTDARDNTTYMTTKIGTQIWMKENLNYQSETGNSRCYRDEESNCDEVGRLYDWGTAMGIEEIYNSNLWGGGDTKRQGICPAGWHLPSRAEWGELVQAAGGGDMAGNALKAKIGWTSSHGTPEGGGTDEYGFSALPGATRPGSAESSWRYDYGSWWTATENEEDGRSAYYRLITYEDDGVSEGSMTWGSGRPGRFKSDDSSVRCVRN